MIREAKRPLNRAYNCCAGEVILGRTKSGHPVVSLNPCTTTSGTRSFDDPDALSLLANDLRGAAMWLATERAKDLTTNTINESAA